MHTNTRTRERIKENRNGTTITIYNRSHEKWHYAKSNGEYISNFSAFGLSVIGVRPPPPSKKTKTAKYDQDCKRCELTKGDAVTHVINGLGLQQKYYI